MILGDSLQVMASLAQREGLRGKVQCIYIDPPYGIKFNSNFQWSTTSRDVKDGNVQHITREPEQVKAFRDTWRDGIHSYLTYLKDRLIVARDLLKISGSIFVQIGNENVHQVRCLLDEVFGGNNFLSLIPFIKTSSKGAKYLDTIHDYLLWYARDKDNVIYNQLYKYRSRSSLDSGYGWVEENLQERRLTSKEKREIQKVSGKRFATSALISQSGGEKSSFPVECRGNVYYPSRNSFWKTNLVGFSRLSKSNRLVPVKNTLNYKRYSDDFPVVALTSWWGDTKESTFATNKIFVVQTYSKVIERCILMASNPGDLVLDPTCGSGTTAYVSEQWGRRWITIDTSRVALALARARLMGARYSFYILKDTYDGQLKEAEISRSLPFHEPVFGSIRQGFIYNRVPHIMLKNIAHNSEIDVIWEEYQDKMEPIRKQVNTILNENWEEWEVPREGKKTWPHEAKELHQQWWDLRMARQKEIDASIAAKSEYEYLYDQPYEDNTKIRVAGPFTVESLSPHRILAVDENDELIDSIAEGKAGYGEGQSFTQMVLENLKTAGVQQAHKEDKINFASLVPWPGDLICAEGKYYPGKEETGAQKRAAIFLGPEFGTVARPDLVAAAREAADAGFDVLIACAFNFDAQSTEFDKLGKVPVLKARMNADLHMADDLKNTGKGNLFVIFGEPDIDILQTEDDKIQIKINGVDVFDPSSGEVRSDNADGIACWFIDTDYNEESFFVRHAYFLGANDPYKSLKTTLRAEINEEAWESLHSDTSRPFNKPKSGRIAVKVINHLGDEVMKVFKV